MTGTGAGQSLKVFFHVLRACYQQAAQDLHAVELDYRIAGHDIRLCFAGPALIPLLTPALAHLAQPAAARPDFTVLLWDSVSTGVPLPLRSWRERPDRRQESQGETPSYYLNDPSGRIKALVSLEGHCVSLIDLDENLAVFWVRRVADIPVYERAAPLRTLWHWWLCEQGQPLVHAGAVASGNNAALIAGRGGAGKSTTALSCLAGGLDYLSDDYCVVSLQPEASVYSLFNSAKLEARHLYRRLPEFAAYIKNHDELQDEKAVLSVYEAYPQQMRLQAVIKAMILPVQTATDQPRLTPVSSFAALHAFAPSSLLQLPGFAQADLSRLTRLVRYCACYQLELTADPGKSALLVRSLLES